MKRNKLMQAQYLTAKDVRQIFGGITHMYLHRWLNDESKNFPKPVYIGNRRYFKVEEIEKFKELLDGSRTVRARLVKNPS